MGEEVEVEYFLTSVGVGVEQEKLVPVVEVASLLRLQVVKDRHFEVEEVAVSNRNNRMHLPD